MQVPRLERAAAALTLMAFLAACDAKPQVQDPAPIKPSIGGPVRPAETSQSIIPAIGRNGVPARLAATATEIIIPSPTATIVFPTPTESPEATLPPETDVQVIARAADKLIERGVTRNQMESDLWNLPLSRTVEGTRTLLSRSKNPFLETAERSLRSASNPSGIPVETLPSLLLPEKLSQFTAAELGGRLNIGINMNGSKLSQHANIDIALELLLAINAGTSLQEQFTRTPSIEKIGQDHEGRADGATRIYAMVSRAIIYHHALVGNVDGIGRERLIDARKFIEADQEETNPSWRQYWKERTPDSQGRFPV